MRKKRKEKAARSYPNGNKRQMDQRNNETNTQPRARNKAANQPDTTLLQHDDKKLDIQKMDRPIELLSENNPYSTKNTSAQRNARKTAQQITSRLA